MEWINRKSMKIMRKNTLFGLREIRIKLWEKFFLFFPRRSIKKMCGKKHSSKIKFWNSSSFKHQSECLFIFLDFSKVYWFLFPLRENTSGNEWKTFDTIFISLKSDPKWSKFQILPRIVDRWVSERIFKYDTKWAAQEALN